MKTATAQDPRESRKAELLREFTTRRMMRLPDFLAGLCDADKDLLLEAHQEAIAKLRVSA